MNGSRPDQPRGRNSENNDAMQAMTRKVEITLEDTVVIESRLSSRRRRPRVPDEVRRAGSAAISQYLAFRTRAGQTATPFVVEHIEVATY